ncbi:MAG: sulfotransferase domain-containing protein [Bacteroidetes bacterium]|nr:sulfotransferase domain-containing protein [Bacteroidota bacterium]
MQGKNNIIWLTSYPKSGNTWMRMFLHALKTGCDHVENFEQIEGSDGIASSRSLLDELLGIYTSDMVDIEIQKLRADAYRLYSSELTEEIIVKVHDAAFHGGILTFPKEVTKKVIYIVRNPFDMVASYANHMGSSIEKSVQSLCDGNGFLAGNKKKLNNQVTQYMGSWSDHYNSWKNLYRENIEVIRYEDMLNDSFATFNKVVKCIGWEKTNEEIEKAISVSDFKNLRSVEEQAGFREKPKETKHFFRQGKSGQWKNEITPEQAKTLVDRHFYTLLELNYIDAAGNILV